MLLLRVHITKLKTSNIKQTKLTINRKQKETKTCVFALRKSIKTKIRGKICEKNNQRLEMNTDTHRNCL